MVWARALASWAVNLCDPGEGLANMDSYRARRRLVSHISSPFQGRWLPVSLVEIVHHFPTSPTLGNLREFFCCFCLLWHSISVWFSIRQHICNRTKHMLYISCYFHVCEYLFFFLIRFFSCRRVLVWGCNTRYNPNFQHSWVGSSQAKCLFLLSRGEQDNLAWCEGERFSLQLQGWRILAGWCST